jgi:hypothetical protein
VEPWELKSLLEEHPKIRRITVETRVSSISRNWEKTVARVRVCRVDWEKYADLVREAAKSVLAPFEGPG